MFAALLGFPGPGIPFGSPKPPVCTLLTGATTVAGAGLPGFKLATFTSSLGAFGWLSSTTILDCSGTRLRSKGFVSSVRALGTWGFRTKKTCGCLGFSSGGSGTIVLGLGTIGFGSGGGTFGFIFGGGGGVCDGK